MKTPKVFIALIAQASLLLLSGCNPDQLELVNPNQITPETFFETEIQVQQAVNAVYAVLQTRGLYQRTLYFAMDNMSHEQTMNPATEADKRQFSTYTFDATHGGITDYWKNCYKGIYRANFVICNADAIDKIPEGKMSQAKKNKYIGEARFLRALY